MIQLIGVEGPLSDHQRLLNRWRMITIPVLIDDTGDEASADLSLGKLIRCTYFAIDAYAPSPGWTLELQQHRIPFLMTGLTGVIYTPAGSLVPSNAEPTRKFASKADIEETYGVIESTGNLYVDTARIYIPLTFVSDLVGQEAVKRQNVLRMRRDLFEDCFGFARGTIDASSFSGRLDRHRQSDAGEGSVAPRELAIAESSDESRVFLAWSLDQNREAQTQVDEWIRLRETHSEEQNTSVF